MDNGKNRITTSSNSFIRYFGFIMVIVYLGVGSWLIFSPIDIGRLSTTTRVILGIMMIFYGIFRAYRAYQLLRHEKSDS
jgi:hypothetical protein